MVIIRFSFALLGPADLPGIPASHVPGRLCRDGDGGGSSMLWITNGLETGIVYAESGLRCELSPLGAMDQVIQVPVR